jgi:hypothetical protein
MIHLVNQLVTKLTELQTVYISTEIDTLGVVVVCTRVSDDASNAQYSDENASSSWTKNYRPLLPNIHDQYSFQITVFPLMTRTLKISTVKASSLWVDQHH